MSLSSGQADSADPGESIAYVHILTNTGNILDTFNLSAVSSQNWEVTLSPNPTLAGGAYTTVYVTLTVPMDAAAGTRDDTPLTAVSQFDANVSATVTDTTTVNPVRGVSFSPDRMGTTDPGEIVTYTHLLTNTGNGTDTFHINHVSSQDWTVTYNTPVTLDAGQQTSVVVSITVPQGVLSDTMDMTVITATSETSSTISDSVVDITIVNRVTGITLAPGQTQSTPPGTIVTYAHSLTNTGNCTDAFSLVATSSQGWNVSLTPSGPLTLTAGNSVKLTLSVVVPKDAAVDTTDYATIKAVSQANPSVSATTTDTTTIIDPSLHHVYLPLSVVAEF